MFTSQNVLGSMVLDFHSNRLEAVFLRETGATNDWFSILKEGTHPPVLTNAAVMPAGEFQFTVLCRAFRTNVLEATSSLATPLSWTAVATNVPSKSTFNFTNPGAASEPELFYRVSKP
jgi:hypothetical protein